MRSLFRLASNLDHPAARAELKGTGSLDRLVDYFVYKQGDGKFLSFVTPRFLAQEGYARKGVSQTDYIEGPGSIPLFSQAFASAVGQELQGDLELIKCVVECKGQDFPFFAGRVLHLGEFVDPSKSSYHTLTDGTRILERAGFRDDWIGDFALAREISDPSRMLGTSKFRELVVHHHLQIRLLEPI